MTKSYVNKAIKDFQRLHEKKAKLEEEVLRLDIEMYGIVRELAIQMKESLDE